MQSPLKRRAAPHHATPGNCSTSINATMSPRSHEMTIVFLPVVCCSERFRENNDGDLHASGGKTRIAIYHRCRDEIDNKRRGRERKKPSKIIVAWLTKRILSLFTTLARKKKTCLSAQCAACRNASAMSERWTIRSRLKCELAASEGFSRIIFSVISYHIASFLFWIRRRCNE